MGYSCTTNSGNQASDRNNDEEDEYENNKNNGSDDGKSNRKHASYVMNKPGIISEKQSSSQARKILDA